jgi:hypothetical protein
MDTPWGPLTAITIVLSLFIPSSYMVTKVHDRLPESGTGRQTWCCWQLTILFPVVDGFHLVGSMVGTKGVERIRERGTWACSASRELRPETRNGDDRERRPQIVCNRLPGYRRIEEESNHWRRIKSGSWTYQANVSRSKGLPTVATGGLPSNREYAEEESLPKKMTGHRRRGRWEAAGQGEEHSRQIEIERVESGNELEGRTPWPWPVSLAAAAVLCGQVRHVCVCFSCWIRKKETLVGFMGFSCRLSLASSYDMVFSSVFHLAVMHRSRNIVSEALQTHSNSVGNMRNEYTHLPRRFHKIVSRVPRSSSSFPMFREHNFYGLKGIFQVSKTRSKP